jgi:drug/metabolite transporter (DMT)-like permease
VLTRLTDRPEAMAIAGAVTIAFSSILVRAADVSPSTAAIFRCAYAVPVLFVLARREDRRQDPDANQHRQPPPHHVPALGHPSAGSPRKCTRQW